MSPPTSLDGDVLPSASSLLTTWWAPSNLVTPHPTQLYVGDAMEYVSETSLRLVLEHLRRQWTSVEPKWLHQGTLTWELGFAVGEEHLIAHIPRGLDKHDRHGRSRASLPEKMLAHGRALRSAGLIRFLLPPVDVTWANGTLPIICLEANPRFLPLSFGHGQLRVGQKVGQHTAMIPLGPSVSAEVMSEVVACLVYHSDPFGREGAVVTDVYFNDADFRVRRNRDGSFALRMQAVRQLEPDVGPNRFLSYLIQLSTHERLELGGEELGMPVPISNPSIAFAGVVKGCRYRALDRGLPGPSGVEQAERWIASYFRSTEGHSYRPWAEQFLAGKLPPTWGRDLREGTWNLGPLRQRADVLTLRARILGDSESAVRAAQFQSAIGHLVRIMAETRASESAPGAPLPANGLLRTELEAGLRDRLPEGVAPDRVLDAVCTGWPFADQHALTQKLSCLLEPKGVDLVFRVAPATKKNLLGTLAGLEQTASPQPPEGHRRARALPNPELLGQRIIPLELETLARQTFPSFEQYMDACLHDPSWGYYGFHVQIGERGHFDTHPEALSPHFGAWIAHAAFRAWQRLVARGDLSSADTFYLIEFGAGNGRLARDIIDTVRRRVQAEDDATASTWRTFSDQLDVRIYELSPSLRQRQQELLGRDAVVLAGDARNPESCLRRDLPEGVRGLIVTNEVPDAFGVHKVVLLSDGAAQAALVIPRIEAALLAQLPPQLKADIEQSDARIRASFQWSAPEGERFLSRASFLLVMSEVSSWPLAARKQALNCCWFEEGYVRAQAFPELAAHLSLNQRSYQSALSAGSPGVVLYVNLHAEEFIRGIGRSLSAGFVLSIDYGGSTRELIETARQGRMLFRTYGEADEFTPRTNDPYCLPGLQDLTADVNFTTLASAGRDVGLSVLHYGSETDLAAHELERVLREEGTTYESLLDEYGFRVLVQGTFPGNFFDERTSPSLPLV